MSVIMVLRVKGDVDAFERYASGHSDQLVRIADEGKRKGAIHHLFAARDGEVVVIDEWSDEEAFTDFFKNQTEIPKIMREAGAQGQPEITFYRKLDTADEF